MAGQKITYEWSLGYMYKYMKNTTTRWNQEHQGL